MEKIESNISRSSRGRSFSFFTKLAITQYIFSIVGILLKIGVLTQTTVPFGLKLWNRNMHALQV